MTLWRHRERDFETNRYRRNSRSDWVVVRDAHPALIDRATFDTVQQKIQAHASKPRGRTHDYLLTGLVSCANCGDILIGTRRTRTKLVGGAAKTYAYLLYICSGTVQQKGLCRQVSLPRDGFERAVLRVLDEEIFHPEALARLEHQLRLEVERRRAGSTSDGITALERRALDLQNRIAEAARRPLQVGDDLIPEVTTAIEKLKADLQRIRTTIDAKRRNATLAADGEELVRRTLDEIKSMSAILRDPKMPLERRREVLRRLLPTRDGMRPIRVEIDVNAPRALAEGAAARDGAPPVVQDAAKSGMSGSGGSNRGSRTTGGPGVGTSRRALDLRAGAGVGRSRGGPRTRRRRS